MPEKSTINSMLFQDKKYCYEEVLAVLSSLRVLVAFEEYDIHQLINEFGAQSR